MKLIKADKSYNERLISFYKENVVLMSFEIIDRIRSGAFDTIEGFKKLGITPITSPPFSKALLAIVPIMPIFAAP